MSRLVVVVPGRGVIRWRPNGTRLVVPFPGSGSGRRFFDLVDDVLLAGAALSPAGQAARLVERIPNAELRS